MNRRPWDGVAIVHGVAKSWTHLTTKQQRQQVHLLVDIHVFFHVPAIVHSAAIYWGACPFGINVFSGCIEFHETCQKHLILCPEDAGPSENGKFFNMNSIACLWVAFCKLRKYFFFSSQTFQLNLLALQIYRVFYSISLVD